MSLIKKNIVISQKNTIGFLTVVRVGDAVGAKLVLNEWGEEPIVLAIKIDNFPIIVRALTGKITEFNIDADLVTNSEINVAIFGKGILLGEGGRKKSISYKEVENYMEVTSKENVNDTKADNITERVVEPKNSQRYVNQNATKTSVQEDTAETNTSSKDMVIDKSLLEECLKKEGINFFKDKSKDNYYTSIRGRVEEIIKSYPEEKSLNQLIPESSWVMINYSPEDYYVFGILKSNKIVTHIGYGLLGVEGIAPPPEVEGYSDFLPIKSDGSIGYYLMFQDAKTGALVK